MGGGDRGYDREPQASARRRVARVVPALERPDQPFAVSDTEPTTTRIRRVTLGHALLSYAFGTGVLAVAINLVTNLGQ